MVELIKWWKAYYKFASSFVGYTSFLLIISVFFYFFIKKQDKEICIEKKSRFSSWDYHGIVGYKYKDSADHMYNILILSNKRKLNLNSILLDSDQVYENIQIGDSLSKHRGSDTLWIYKEDRRLHYVFEECDK